MELKMIMKGVEELIAYRKVERMKRRVTTKEFSDSFIKYRINNDCFYLYPTLPCIDFYKGYREHEFDGDGLINISALENRYHPTLIAMYALANYNEFVRSKEEEYKRIFLKHVHWLKKNAVSRNGSVIWFLYFEPIGYNCNIPWISAMTQGLAISALVRAYNIRKDEKLLELAHKALKSFEIPISKGGVLHTDDNGNCWYEEAACPNSASILNGFIFSLMGVYDFYEITKDEKAEKIFYEGIETLHKHLTDYELKLLLFRWSRYDNRFTMHSRNYHYVHILQLEWLYQVTKDKFFLEYARKWKEYEERYGRVAGFINLFFSRYRRYLRLIKTIKSKI
jgi:hypothetical protein